MAKLIDIVRENGVDKFGQNPLIPASGSEDVWSQGGTYTFLTGKAVLYLSSSNAGDTQQIAVQGLDINGLLVTRTKALTGQSQVALPGEWLRVFRAWNDSGTDLLGDVYVAESDTLSGGVPTTASKIKAKVDKAAQQTLMAIFTMPSNQTGWLVSYYFGVIPKVTSTAWAKFGIFTRKQNKVFLNKFIGGLITSGSSLGERHPKVVIKLDPMEDIKIVALGASANDTDVYGGFGIEYD